MKLVEGTASVTDVDAFVRELSDIGDEYGAVVQAFDARYVAGRAHLEAAVRAARRAIEHEDAIADGPALEVLLYAAGRRQIDRALTIGLSDGEQPVVVVVDGGDETAAAAAVENQLEARATLGVARDEDAIRGYFDIGEVELAASEASIEELVVERVALLAVEK